MLKSTIIKIHITPNYNFLNSIRNFISETGTSLNIDFNIIEDIKLAVNESINLTMSDKIQPEYIELCLEFSEMIKAKITSGYSSDINKLKLNTPEQKIGITLIKHTAEDFMIKHHNKELIITFSKKNKID